MLVWWGVPSNDRGKESTLLPPKLDRTLSGGQ